MIWVSSKQVGARRISWPERQKIVGMDQPNYNSLDWPCAHLSGRALAALQPLSLGRILASAAFITGHCDTFCPQHVQPNSDVADVGFQAAQTPAFFSSGLMVSPEG